MACGMPLDLASSREPPGAEQQRDRSCCADQHAETETGGIGPGRGPWQPPGKRRQVPGRISRQSDQPRSYRAAAVTRSRHGGENHCSADRPARCVPGHSMLTASPAQAQAASDTTGQGERAASR